MSIMHRLFGRVFRSPKETSESVVLEQRPQGTVAVSSDRPPIMDSNPAVESAIAKLAAAPSSVPRNWEIIQEGVAELVEIGIVAVPRLIKEFENASIAVENRKRAGYVLELIGDRRAIEPLKKVVDGYWSVSEISRESARIVLGLSSDDFLALAYQAKCSLSSMLNLGNDRPELVKAAQNGDLEEVRRLLNEGSNPNSADPNEPSERIPGTDFILGQRSTALNQASSRGFAKIVDALLKAGADPNLTDLKDGYQWSPLLHAAYGGHRECIALLVDAGADVDYYEPLLKYSVLTHAANANCIDIVVYLLEKGANIHKTPDLGLCFACGGAPAMVVALLDDLKSGHSSLEHVIRQLKSLL